MPTKSCRRYGLRWITPVGKVKGASAEWVIGDGTPGPVTLSLREELMGIQYGERPDPHGWIHKIC